MIHYCFEKQLFFTITADRDLAVKEQITSIKKWTKAVDAKGRDLGWEVGETIHTMNKTHHAFRLVVKRTLRSKEQEDLFDP